MFRFLENTQSTTIEKSFLLYLGVGYDAEMTVYFERLRRHIPWMFKINKLNQFYYGLIFTFLLIRNFLGRGIRDMLKDTIIHTKNRARCEQVREFTGFKFVEHSGR